MKVCVFNDNGRFDSLIYIIFDMILKGYVTGILSDFHWVDMWNLELVEDDIEFNFIVLQKVYHSLPKSTINIDFFIIIFFCFLRIESDLFDIT